MSESAGEKSFAPTEKRRRDAAGKGDVLRSRELSTAAVILFAAAWLTFAGPWLLGDLADLLRASLVFDREALMRFEVAPLLGSVLLTVMAPLASLAVPIILLAVASQLAFGEGRWVGGNLIVSTDRIVGGWTTIAPEALTVADLAPALELEPVIIVVGTGTEQLLPDVELMAALGERSVGLEIMSTPAACRTFNVLLQEQRRVVAALFNP